MKRFNLGDTVYLMTDNKIAKGEITYVQTIERKGKVIHIQEKDLN